MQSRSWRCQYGLRCETLENQAQAIGTATIVDSTTGEPRAQKDALNNLMIRACGVEWGMFNREPYRLEDQQRRSGARLP